MEYHFNELEKCPFCGHKTYYIKQRAQGLVLYRMRYDGEEASNELMYDLLSISGGDRAYCEDCDKYLGNISENTVSKEVEKVLDSMEDF